MKLKTKKFKNYFYFYVCVLDPIRNHFVLFYYLFFLSFSFFFSFWKRGREWAHECAGRVRGSERILSRLYAQLGARHGARSHNLEIMIWTKTKSRTLNWLSHLCAPESILFLNSIIILSSTPQTLFRQSSMLPNLQGTVGRKVPFLQRCLKPQNL